jgi:hypothetical protein
LITYRNNHFNYLNNWNLIPFEKRNNILHFNDLQTVRSNFISDTKSLFDIIEVIYKENKHKYTLYDNIMLIKTNDDKYVFSKNRCMDPINNNTQKIIGENGVKLISINDFKDIYEYLCIFYHAKNIIVSYGGVACTNRFFCNPNANVILIGNLHYKYEYEYDNANQLYWHVRHSHIYPAKTQTVLLDFENYINETNVGLILNLIK